jgi:thymidylate synthase (FAD)
MGFETNGVTKRVTSPGAEKWLKQTQQVLNGGEIELVDYMGSEEQMVGIARISHGKILPHTDKERAQKLISYFTENIFVARQVVRHRTVSINEQSARYSELSADLYIPDADRVQGQDTKNKQGSKGELPEQVRLDFIEALLAIEATGKEVYGEYLEKGVAKELARIHLPVGVYTNWVWKMDLHNLFHFLGLRLDSHAQYEVRVYAEAIYEVLKDAYPMCCVAFEEFKLYATTFSRSDMSGLRAILTAYFLENPERRKDENLRRIGIKAGIAF